MTNADLLQRDGVRDTMRSWHTPTTKAGQQAAYAALADMYDTDILVHTGYVAYREVVDRLMPYLPSSGKLRILDAGCGTGLSGAYVRAHCAALDARAQLVGVDYSPAMLRRATATRAYASLHERDLDTMFDLAGPRVDAVIAAGVFFEHHVEPAAMRNVFAHLRTGGVAAVSVREASFAKRPDEYLAAVERAGCVVVDTQSGPYREAENMLGTYLILRKTRDVDA